MRLRTSRSHLLGPLLLAGACTVYEQPTSTKPHLSNSAGSATAGSPAGGSSAAGTGGPIAPARGGDSAVSEAGSASNGAGSASSESGGTTAGSSAPSPAGAGGAKNTCAFSPNDGAEVGVVPGETPPASQAWTFTLGDSSVVPNSANVPIYPWFPDGHITVLPGSNGDYLMFWAEVESYRTIGTSPLPQSHTKLNPSQQLFHGRADNGDYDNGGIWLHSVFRKAGQNLLGFFVAEDQYCCPRDPQQVAWRSVGVTSSQDDGATWGARQQILTANEERPALSDVHRWGGNGDGSAIWDPQRCRWMFFYQHEYVTAAISTDPEGRPGTWFKYFKASENDAGDFTEPGLRGRDSALPGLDAIHGGNPSVHFNRYLGKWVMVYHGWDPQRSYIATSVDLIHWDAPRVLVDTANPPGRGWYPTIIGDTDLRAGRAANLFYTDMDRLGGRHFMHRPITFTRND